MNKPEVYLTKRFIEATAYAIEMHKDQSRKATSITYISHPLGVASLILEAGFDEDLAIAGLLHDVAEDCGGEPRLVEISSRFGLRVEKIVRGCSDSLAENPEEKAPWRERKTKHISHLQAADDDVLIVTAADKAHNARYGSSTWDRFNAESPEDIIWYYESIYGILNVREISRALLTPLRQSIDLMIDKLNS
jgi:(p)ppGpp synthase/HD superfamily hydrolase